MLRVYPNNPYARTVTAFTFSSFGEEICRSVGLGEWQQKLRLQLLDEKESDNYLKKKPKFLEYLNLDTFDTFGDSFNTSTFQ